MAYETTQAFLNTQKENLKKSKALHAKFTKSILAISLIVFVINILLLIYVPFLQGNNGSVSFFEIEENYKATYIEKYGLDTLALIHKALLAVSIIGFIAVIAVKIAKAKENINSTVHISISVINTVGYLGFYLIHSLTLVEMYPGTGADVVAYAWFAAFFANAVYMWISVMIPAIAKNINKIEGTVEGIKKELSGQ